MLNLCPMVEVDSDTYFYFRHEDQGFEYLVAVEGIEASHPSFVSLAVRESLAVLILAGVNMGRKEEKRS